jgi:hypothetical protein
LLNPLVKLKNSKASSAQTGMSKLRSDIFVNSPTTDEETSDDAGATEKVAESTRVLSQAEAERRGGNR